MAEQTPDEIVANILLGEAVGEGPEGMEFVRDVMATRARNQKKTLQEVATAPEQFSASSWPDLKQFAARQPIILQNLARELVREAMQPDFVPQYDVENYVTTELFSRRDELPPDHWLHQMEPVQTIGRHVALKPRRPRQ